RDLLRLTTAGSVDDGKSTLIGRLLADTGVLGDDQLASLAAQAVREGQEQIDLARITDGLTAEREQGITIDVAYRYFATRRRSYILADVPGHEQYTRNMVTGASKATAALFLVDARNGMTRQTRRHVCIAALLGIEDVVFAVNKMDLVDFSEDAFRKAEAEISNFTRTLPFHTLGVVPVSAKHGDNVVRAGDAMAWHEGPPLIDVLDGLPASTTRIGGPLRMAIQMALRPQGPETGDFRGYTGRISQGRVALGDRVAILPGGRESTVTGILTPDGPARSAITGRSVTLTLSDDIDAGRGFLLAAAESPARESRGFEAALCWLDERPQDPRTTYLVRAGTRIVAARIAVPRGHLDIDTLTTGDDGAPLAANDIATTEISLQDDIAYDAYGECRATGSFIVIDPRTNATVAAGMIDHGI
ncbi:MAG TPA: GTP-binding protein, partial [Alphaproteobacteria bacterium]|nr:GTP-binding protein [Alphaproteobacteria bacterium]